MRLDGLFIAGSLRLMFRIRLGGQTKERKKERKEMNLTETSISSSPLFRVRLGSVRCLGSVFRRFDG